MRIGLKEFARGRGDITAVCVCLFVLFLSIPSVNAKPPVKSGDYILRYESLHHPVYAQGGMVVSQNELSSQVGAMILEQGGNAIDAAVAVGFSLAVTLPRAGNLGGGGFLLAHIASEGKTLAIDYRGMAPAAATPQQFLTANGQVDRQKSKHSYAAFTVPGTVAGLYEAHRRWGKLDWKEVIKPAIQQAQKGIVVSRDLSWAIGAKRKVLSNTEASREIFFDQEGEVIREGDLWRQKDLAKSLALIAKHGKDGFYRGKLAARMAKDIQANGGLITEQDFAAYQARVTEPVTTDYRGYQVTTMPPPAGGIHLLQMLEMMEHFPVADYGNNSAESIHLLAEVMKRAYAYRAQYLGDPQFVHVPVDELLNAELMAELASQISMTRATPVADIRPDFGVELNEGPDTTHFSVTDSEGNAVANTYTLSASFGSGIVLANTGVLMNNQMNNFALRHGVTGATGAAASYANSLVAGKRPKSTQTPLIVLSEGRPVLVSGTPGGRRIITTMAQIVSNVIDHQMNIAEATHSPRIYHGWNKDELEYEPGISRDTLRVLESMGHSVKAGSSMGSTQSIVWRNGEFQGSADPRRPGAKAVGIH